MVRGRLSCRGSTSLPWLVPEHLAALGDEPGSGHMSQARRRDMLGEGRSAALPRPFHRPAHALGGPAQGWILGEDMERRHAVRHLLLALARKRRLDGGSEGVDWGRWRVAETGVQGGRGFLGRLGLFHVGIASLYDVADLSRLALAPGLDDLSPVRPGEEGEDAFGLEELPP